MTEQRRYLAPWEKRIVRERQDGRCACGCRTPLEGRAIEYDHIVELWEGGTNDLSNFQALIKKPCHLRKSAKATKRRSKADRCRNFQTTGHGRTHKRRPWLWTDFQGNVKRSEAHDGR